VPELSRAHELAETVVDTELAEVFTHDPAIPILSLLAHALVGTGRTEEGLTASRQAVVLARQTRPPETVAALTAAALLAAARREPAQTHGLAAELLALVMYVVLGSILLGWAEVHLAGDAVVRERGLTRLREAQERYARSGARTFTPLVAVLHSESELAAGHPEESRAVARAGVQAAERHDVRLWWDRLTSLAG
jgi:hypothetical protein